MFNNFFASSAQRRFNRALVLIASILTMLLLAGCVASAKVYNNDKTVVYDGALYNVSNVKTINSNITGKLANEETISLKGADKKQIQKYLNENGEVYVRMSFGMDDQEMLYRSKTIDSWSDYNRMHKDFQSAGKKIASLLGDKKKRQLKLK
jgi:hypothetical protein